MVDNKLTAEELAQLGSLFEEALTIADPDGFAPMPDGEYVSQVVELKITRTKETNKLMAAWRFKVIEGDGEGRNIWKNSILTDDPRNMRRLINDIDKFGITVSDIAGVMDALDALVDEVCLVQLKTDDKNRQWTTIDVPEL